MRDDSEKIAKICECIERIEICAADGKDNFLSDWRTQDIIARNFQVIGQAVKDLSQGLRDHNPDVPWRDVARFRDRVAHDYFDLDLGKVWGIIDKDLPSLKKQIERIDREFRERPQTET